MCIACEMNFWAMIDALPPEAQERILRARHESERFACETPPDGKSDAPKREGERKP
jgi:hypothetical protein